MGTTTVQDQDLATIIGLEVHVQLETETKIFCNCQNSPEKEPNTHTCPTCLGLPGALPILNEAAVEAAVKIGKAIEAEIPPETHFDRKHYFYPDLPKNFQITQHAKPICQNGSLEIRHEGERRAIGIEGAHLEEDPGSLQHVGGSIDTADSTLIDYNRAGTPLMEIVTGPDFRDPAEVRTFLTKLEGVLEYLDVFDSSRDGSLRIDANISLVKRSEVDSHDSIDTAVLEDANRTEIKNISSHKGAEKALAYEVTRQKNALSRGQTVDQETRHWDDARGVTVSMRSKETKKDYRYFAEPDLPPLRVSDWKERITIPELPSARRERFKDEYDLGAEAADKLTSTKQVADFYEEVATEFDPTLAATWVADNLLGELNYRNMAITDIDHRLNEVASLVEMVADEKITAKNAQETVLRQMLDTGDHPETIVEREELGRTSSDAVQAAVEEAIEENPDAVEDFHNGEGGTVNFLVGQVMQKTGGSADPGEVNGLLREELG